MRFQRTVFFIIVVLVAAAVGSSTVYMAQGEYSLSVTPSVDVPDRTTEFNGKEYTVTDIGRVRLGDDISVDAEGPSGTTYDVIVYNNDNIREDFREVTGEGTVSFDTSKFIQGTGSYMIAIQFDGEFRAIHPVVVPAYGASQTAPDAVTTGESVHVSANLTEYESSESIESVEAVIANDDTDQRVDMDETGDLSYEANVSTESLETGDYRLYVVVRGTEMFEGNNELIGFSDPQDLTIRSESTATESATSTEDGSGGQSSGGGSGSAAPPPSTQSPEPNTAESPTSTVATTTTPSSQTVSTVATPSADTPESTTPAPPTTTQTTSDGVINPSTDSVTASTRSSTTTSTGTLIGAFPVFWLALCLAVLAARLR